MSYPYHGFLRFAHDVIWTIDEDGEGNVEINRNGINIQTMIDSAEYLKGIIDRSLSNIIVPSNITSIGSSAFYRCTELTNIVLPDGLQVIGAGSFRYCSKLPIIDIPATVTSIGSNAFGDSTLLKTVIVRSENPPALGLAAFNNSPIEAIYVPDTAVDTYKAANEWSTYASIIRPISEMAE